MLSGAHSSWLKCVARCPSPLLCVILDIVLVLQSAPHPTLTPSQTKMPEARTVLGALGIVIIFALVVRPPVAADDGTPDPSWYVDQKRRAEEKEKQRSGSDKMFRAPKGPGPLSLLRRAARKHLQPEDDALFRRATGASVHELLHHRAWNGDYGEPGMRPGEIVGNEKVIPHPLNAFGLHALRALLAERIADHQRKARGSPSHPLYERFMSDGAARTASLLPVCLRPHTTHLAPGCRHPRDAAREDAHGRPAARPARRPAWRKQIVRAPAGAATHVGSLRE